MEVIKITASHAKKEQELFKVFYNYHIVNATSEVDVQNSDETVTDIFSLSMWFLKN